MSTAVGAAVRSAGALSVFTLFEVFANAADFATPCAALETTVFTAHIADFYTFRVIAFEPRAAFA